MAFFEGLLVGFAFVVFIGPVFFTLLHSAIQFGYRSGVAVALGIFTSDIIIVSMCTLGAAAFLKNPENQFWIALIGATFLIGLGLKYIISPQYKTKEKVDISSFRYIDFFVKGFLINFLNPFVYAVWIGIISKGSYSHGIEKGLFFYLAGTLIGILSTDLIKVFFAEKIKILFQPKSLIWILRVIGVGLIGFGVRLLIFGILSLPII